MLEIKDGYDLISDEYYSEKHITSRNFDSTTINGIESIFDSIKHYLNHSIKCLELGAGRGNTDRYLKLDPKSVIISDLTKNMLVNSSTDYMLKLVADARNTPFLNNSFKLVTGFLYDPYNEPILYSEIARILKTDGLFIGTLPHNNWGLPLRKHLGIDLNKTQFILDNGSVLETNSFLSTKSQLIAMHKSAGMEIIRYEEFFLPKTTVKISPHIRLVAEIRAKTEFDIPLIQLIISRKK